MDRVIKIITKTSYKNLFIVFLISHSLLYSTGTVVFLHGTGSAGKTTICKALATDRSWHIVDEDAIYYEEAPRWWQEKFPEEFDIILEAIQPENILHAIMRNQVSFKYGTDRRKQDQVYEAIKAIQGRFNDPQNKLLIKEKKEWHEQLRLSIIKQIKDHAQHSHVIIDTWFLKEEHLTEIRDTCRTIDALAYCPLAVMINRTIERNNKAVISNDDISSMRFFHQPLMSFIGLYNLHKHDPNNQKIDTLNKIELVSILDKVEKIMKQDENSTGASQLFTRGEFSPEQFKDYKEQLLAKFEEQETLSVIPNIKAPVILTHLNSAQESVNIINRMINSSRI